MKASIAHRGGFVELPWDGYIKLLVNKKEIWKKKQIQMKQRQQIEFARHLNTEGEQEEQKNEEHKAGKEQ